jgi:hypothetical protein
MAVDPLTGLAIALRNQVGRELYDTADTYHSFASVLLAMDNMYGTTSRFMKSTDVSGEKAQVNFRTGLPQVQGVNAITGSLASLELPVQQNFSVVGGKAPWSHYQLREDIRRAYVDHISKDKAKTLNWIKDVSKAARDAVVKKLNEDWFPLAAVSASSTAYNAAENACMAVPYALQTATSGTYELLEINLAAAQYQQLQATVKTSFGTPELSTVRKNILMPLKQKGANVDLVICDSSVYDYILTEAEVPIRYGQSDKLDYGGEYVRYAGRYWLPESRLDDFFDATGGREIYFLDSSTWEFCQQGMQDDFTLMPNPNTSKLLTMLGGFVCRLTCHLPRYNGRATGVTLS